MRPVTAPLDVEVPAPPSKSDTHRALVAAALARGRTTVRSPLFADDTNATAHGLTRLGLVVERTGDDFEVEGLAGRVPGGATLDLGQSGTSARFLTAVAALGEAESRLDGSPRLRERPLEELVSALAGLGARPSATRLPLDIGGTRVRGGAVTLPSQRSSQFASALLLIGARLPGGLELELEGPRVSMPYVEMTLSTLSRFGVIVDRPDADRFRVPPIEYPGAEYSVEGDHSSASYCLAAAAMAGGRVRVTGLDPASAQPDARLAADLERAGCRVSRGADWVEVRSVETLRPFDVDLSDAPDLAPTLAVLGLCSPGRSVLRGVSHLRYKESDRLAALVDNLNALGRGARSEADRLIVEEARTPLRGARIRTASDHRIAMAFAVAGLAVEGIELDDAACVSKSDPAFWARFSSLEASRG